MYISSYMKFVPLHLNTYFTVMYPILVLIHSFYFTTTIFIFLTIIVLFISKFSISTRQIYTTFLDLTVYYLQTERLNPCQKPVLSLLFIVEIKNEIYCK